MQGLTALRRYINVPDIRQRLVVSAALFQRISVRWHFVGSDFAPEVLPDDWTRRVLENQLPVMVHLWSDIHVRRRTLAQAPVVDEVAREFEGKLEAYTMAFDTDYNALKYQDTFLPVVHFFKGGEIVETVVPEPDGEFEAAYDQLYEAAAKVTAN